MLLSRLTNGARLLGFQACQETLRIMPSCGRRGMMTDLGTLPGDYSSFGSGINDKGQVVGSSCDQRGTCRAFLWQNGTMTDLNLLIAPHPGST